MNQFVVTIKTVSTGAETIANIFDGQRLARLPSTIGKKFRVTYCSTASVDDYTEQVFVGNDSQPVHSSHVSIESATDRLVTRDDVVATFEAEAGTEIIAEVVAPAAGSHHARLIVVPLN